MQINILLKIFLMDSIIAKMKWLLLFVVFFTLMLGVAYTQSSHNHGDNKELNDSYLKINTQAIRHKIQFLEIPAHITDDELIKHSGFTLLYNEKHEQAQWVAYELTKEETNNTYQRTNKFLPDPSVKTKTANDNDYLGSGYDRGHLAPASDMGWSAQTMFESFYYSNMSPQEPSFNRGIWKKLEEQVRAWAINYDSIYVVTGPVLKDNLLFIGENKVSVPEYYYKVILDLTSRDKKGMGFIMKNEGSGLALSNFAVTIDSIEHITGIDFFPLLEDEFEHKIESSICLDCWQWKPVKINSQKKDHNGSDHDSNHKTANDNLIIKEEADTQTTFQCIGYTQAGKRCKRKTNSSTKRCFQHGGD